jgi:DNA-binding transcriptional MerR regulator
MNSGDEQPLWWSDAMRMKDQMTLRELADHLGVTVGTLTSEMKKAGVARRVRVPASVSGGMDEDQPSRRNGSKDDQIEKLFHLLGKVPDSEVARLADVSVRTVASYRARNGIDGYKGPRRRPAPRGRRASKLEDYRSMLGKLPDRVVAEEAGMSLGAVRNFRVKHDIPAAGRMPRSEIERLTQMLRKMVGSAEASDAPVTKPSKRVEDGLLFEFGESQEPTHVLVASVVFLECMRVFPLGPTRAWRMSIGGDDGDSMIIVVAENLLAAVEKAVSSLGGDDHVIYHVESLGPVLSAS